MLEKWSVIYPSNADSSDISVILSNLGYDVQTRNIKPIRYTVSKFERHVNLLLLEHETDAQFELYREDKRVT